MNAAALSSTFLLAVFCFGCTSTSVSPREAFLRAHPGEREKYLKFWEISPEALLRASEQDYSARRTLVRSLKKDYAKYPDLIERLDAVDSRLAEFAKHEHQSLRELQAEFDPKKDTLFFYVRLDGKHEEDAWIIVRDNRVRKKYVLATGEWNLPESK